MSAALMIQGCGSGVGKSTLVAGLCRLFADRGLRVRPFKPQNMSNNAAVTMDGGEIGRAQALQAQAARTPASVHMNPILLKPQSDVGAQLIVQGRMRGTWTASALQPEKPRLLQEVLDSFHRLQAQADLVLVEGAGSPAEVNLRAGDIANMGFARASGTPVVLLGDIDRGHVIAALVGAHAVLEAQDRDLVRGFIVNRFRGDARLFDAGRTEIEKRTGWRDLGLVPWSTAARALPAEDAPDLDLASPAGADGAALQVVVPLLPGLANHDDLDALRSEPAVDLAFLAPGQALPASCDLVILGGSKATLSDLARLRSEGWDVDIRAHVRRGGRVLGLCGGYQMLGRGIADPLGLEGPAGSSTGLGLLEVDTTLEAAKTLRRVQGRLAEEEDAGFEGYEIHLGRTEGPGTSRPFLRMADGRPDGATSADGRVAGCYVHGLFDRAEARAALLARFGRPSNGRHRAADVDAHLDALAATLGKALDVDALARIAGL